MLAREGLLAGCYTSPHVTGWAERIRVGGSETPTSSWRSAVCGRRRSGSEPRSSRCSRQPRSPSSPPTGVDAAVVEAGLGGRHDATNVLAFSGSGADERGARAHARARPDPRGDRRGEARGRQARGDGLPRRGRMGIVGPRARRRARHRRAGRERGACRGGRRGVPRPRCRGRGRHRPWATRAPRHGDLGRCPHPGGGALHRAQAADRGRDRRVDPAQTRTSTGCWRNSVRLADALVATASSNERALSAEELAERARPYFEHVEAVADPTAALGAGARARRAGARHRLPLPAGRPRGTAVRRADVPWAGERRS